MLSRVLVLQLIHTLGKSLPFLLVAESQNGCEVTYAIKYCKDAKKMPNPALLPFSWTQGLRVLISETFSSSHSQALAQGPQGPAVCDTKWLHPCWRCLVYTLQGRTKVVKVFTIFQPGVNLTLP